MRNKGSYKIQQNNKADLKNALEALGKISQNRYIRRVAPV